jgi:death-on-curing protein
VRDEGSLESAVNQGQAGFGGDYLHEFPFGMASAYAFHIAQNQPFVDGNKRAALAAALVFLELNGYEIATPDPRLYDSMIAIAEHRQTKLDLQATFAAGSTKVK